MGNLPRSQAVGCQLWLLAYGNTRASPAVARCMGYLSDAIRAEMLISVPVVGNLVLAVGLRQTLAA